MAIKKVDQGVYVSVWSFIGPLFRSFGFLLLDPFFQGLLGQLDQ